MKKRMNVLLLLLIIFTFSGCKVMSHIDFVEICKEDRIYSLNIEKKGNNRYLLTGKFFDNYQLYDYKFMFNKNDTRSLILNDLGLYSSYFVSMNFECEQSLGVKKIRVLPKERCFLTEEMKVDMDEERFYPQINDILAFKFENLDLESYERNRIFILDYYHFGKNDSNTDKINSIISDQYKYDLNTLLDIEWQLLNNEEYSNDINYEYTYVVFKFDICNIGKQDCLRIQDKFAIAFDDAFCKVINGDNSQAKLYLEWLKDTNNYWYYDEEGKAYKFERKIWNKELEEMTYKDFMEIQSFNKIRYDYMLYVDEE